MRSLQLIMACLVLSLTARGQQPATDVRVDVSSTAAAIDDLFMATWKTENVVAAAPASDAEFLRRLHLDLGGRIPAISDVRDFLADTDPEKRQQAVDRLLDSPAFVRHFTIVWRNALIPQANSEPQLRSLIPGFEAWLWQHLSTNRPYDQIVRDMITTELNPTNAAALASTTSPDAFFVARELKPENLATGTARAFLGVRLDCAQCHDHPFDKWKQSQFWNLAAFYSGFARPDTDDDNPAMAMTMVENTATRSIRIPGSDTLVPARFLNGDEPDWVGTNQTPRAALAEWLVNEQNPWFARMAVNRMWEQFFGRGLVDPVDDFSDNNPPSHPDVLQILAQAFVSSGYDLQHVIRIITATRVYQLSSAQSHPSQTEPQHFARSVLRGLTPEQFFDSLAEAVGFYQPYRSDNPFVIETDSPRARFLELFRDSSESGLEAETTILQALAMMNGEFIGTATSPDDSQTLRAITEFPGMTDDERLETVFLATVSRPPTDKEREKLTEYLKSGSPDSTPGSALSDIFWALLNSSEFLLNH
ncbi:MAG: DUF1549 and DUF1553 domain-containing protein [Planctomycetaceae bacterium]